MDAPISSPLLDLMPPILLDSGAFTAWTKKVHIDLDSYIEFCHLYKNHVAGIVVLDSIPGEFGRKPSLKETKLSAEKSWENFEIMVGSGLPREKVIPVFHQNEDDVFLERMVQEAPYFGLSPANDRGTTEKIRWLDRCMKICTDKKGLPKNKWHGFAVTSVRLMTRFPWYSVDSASWRISAAYGKVLVVTDHEGSFYDISEESEMTKAHFDLMSPVIKNKFLAKLKAYGFELQMLRTDALYRSMWNAIAYRDLQNLLPEWPWPYKSTRSASLGIL